MRTVVEGESVARTGVIRTSLRWSCLLAGILAAASPSGVRAEEKGAEKGTSATIPTSPTVLTTPWPLTDALGRSAPLRGNAPAADAPPPRPGRQVGIFYFLWQEHADRKRRDGDGSEEAGPYDVSKILAQDPDALGKPDSPLWGPVGAYHYWAEPLFGYYRPTDPWILRRHAHLLSDAGIDVLIFDATNALTYRDVYRKLCEVFEDVRREGGRTPHIAFMVNTQAGKTAETIYRDLYRTGLHRDLWFLWEGKPLMLCDPAEAGPELQEFFTLRRAHWPFEMVNTPYAWHWEAAYPQPYGYTADPAIPEQVNVSVAQNLRWEDGRVTNMSSGDARGRSFHAGKRGIAPGSVERGYNVEEQWRRAFELDPPFVMVTGWNEWIAGRWGKPEGPIVFVDQYDEEHSRDIEPMLRGHGDNYYCQLVANVRRYKGVPSLPESSAPATIRSDGAFDAWGNVAPAFEDHVGETAPRDFGGIGGLRYVERSGRNDIVLAKVARDRTHLYFYVKTREPLSPRTDPGWMWLLLDLDGDPRSGWEGFEWCANRAVDSDGTVWLERTAGGPATSRAEANVGGSADGGSEGRAGRWAWEKAAPIALRSEGRELHLAIPRKALGLPEGTTRVSVDFKWVDNLPRSGDGLEGQEVLDVLDLYSRGDVAPEGRFRYRYAAE